MPLPRTAAATLQHATRDLDDGGFVFTGADGVPIRAGSFRARFGTLVTERAALVGLRMHDLRRTAVSLWIAHGASAKQVQVWAGHRSVATVFDRCGHLFPGGEDPVMDSLDASASLRATLGQPRITREIRAMDATPLESCWAPGHGKTPAAAGVSSLFRWWAYTDSNCGPLP